MFCRCLLNIPHTFIFREGYPIKALCTNDKGYVTRLSLENVLTMEREVSDRGLQGESNKMLRTCRRLLLDYTQINDYVHAQNTSDPILCNVSLLTYPLSQPLSVYLSLSHNNNIHYKPCDLISSVCPYLALRVCVCLCVSL